MPKPGKPWGTQSVAISNGKVSYLLLKRKQNFPPICTIGAPVKNHLVAVKAVDKSDDPDTASVTFDATIVSQGVTNKNRLAIKLVSTSAGGGADPLDGAISVTLYIVADIIDGAPVLGPMDVSDVPVDYISDPSAP